MTRQSRVGARRTRTPEHEGAIIMSTTRVAYHEAGHATVAIVRGVAIDRVAIVPSAFCRTSLKMEALETSDALIFLCGGPAAEAKYLKRAVEMTGHDLTQGLALARLLTRDGQETADTLARYQALASAAVVAHWRSIERVAATPVRRTTLYGKDVEALMPGGGETRMRMNDGEAAFEREQQAGVAAAAANGRPAGGDAGTTVALARTMVDDIAASPSGCSRASTRSPRSCSASWSSSSKCAWARGRRRPRTGRAPSSPFDGSLGVARSDSAGVRPGSTHCWQLAGASTQPRNRLPPGRRDRW
jgi:hypothetical protein